MFGKTPMSLKSGHRIIPVAGKEQEQQVQDFLGNAVGTIRLQPDGWFLTLPFIEFADKLYDFKFKPSDVVVMTYPKCGTTWTQEIVWTLLHNPNLDHPKRNLPVNVRCPFIEVDFLMKNTNVPPMEPGHEFYDMFAKLLPDKNPEEGIFLQLAELTSEPRVIKTHLPFSTFPASLIDTCKVIYVVRNPKDVAVSYYHHSRLFSGHGYVGTLDSFVDHFVNDTLLFSPYWTHIKEAWSKREHPNLHFCYFEDMKANSKAAVEQFQDFLGTTLTEQQINNVVEYTNFSAMKERDNVLGDAARGVSMENSFVNIEVLKSEGGFFRKGITGDWKNKLAEEHVRKIEEWTRKNVEYFGPDFKYGENSPQE